MSKERVGLKDELKPSSDPICCNVSFNGTQLLLSKISI